MHRWHRAMRGLLRSGNFTLTVGQVHRQLATKSRVGLRGRDFQDGDFLPEELKAILWTAADLRLRITEKHEVAVLQEAGCVDVLNTLALGKASHLLGGNVTTATVDLQTDEAAADIGSAVAGVSDVIAVRCGRQSALRSLADAAPVPLINIGTNHHDPLTVAAELMAVLDYYGYLRRLSVCWAGPASARLHSYLQMLPPLGVHLRYCCAESEDLSADECAAFVARTIRYNTQFSQHRTTEGAAYRAHVLTTTDHAHTQLTLTQKHAAEADLDWTFVQSLPRNSSAVASAVYWHRERSLVRAAAACRVWVAAALLVHLTTDDHERRTERPNFEGQG